MSTQYNQCQIEYMLNNGASSTEKGLCTKEFLLAQGVADAALGDMWFEYLTPIYPGGFSRTSMEAQFWFDQGCRDYSPGIAGGTPPVLDQWLTASGSGEWNNADGINDWLVS